MEGGGSGFCVPARSLGSCLWRLQGDQPALQFKEQPRNVSAGEGIPAGMGRSWGLCCHHLQLLVQEQRGHLWGGSAFAKAGEWVGTRGFPWGFLWLPHVDDQAGLRGIYGLDKKVGRGSAR